MERATGIEPAPPAWELKLPRLYFQYQQNRSEQMWVRAVPDLRIAGDVWGTFSEILKTPKTRNAGAVRVVDATRTGRVLQ